MEHNWLGAEAAVTLAAVICLAVGAYSLVAQRRSPDGPVAPALLTVAVLGLLADIWVTVFGLEWIEPWVGAVLIGLTCALGLGIARWWDQVWLAFVLMVTGGLFLAPATLWLIWDDRSPPVEAACLLSLGIIGWASTAGRYWLPVDIAAALVFLSGAGLVSDSDAPVALTTASLVAVVVLTGLGLFPVAPSSTSATVIDLLARWGPAVLMPALILLNTAAWSGYHDDAGNTSARWCALVIGLVACTVPGVRSIITRESLALPRRPQAPPAMPPIQHGPPGYPVIPVPRPVIPASVADAMRAALATGLTTLGVVMTSLYVNSDWTWWLCAVVIVAGALVWFSPALPPVVPWLFGGFTVLACLHLLGPAWTREIDMDARPLWLPPLLLLVVGLLVLYREDALHHTRPGKIVAGGVLLILGTSAIPLLARDITDTDNSFMTGHLIVSVLWMLVGVFFLLRVDAAIGPGITLLATAKLVLYDLAALDGLVQVAAFIICGLILLACAAFRDRSSRTTPGDDAPGGPGTA
ncbi:MAG: hypothetical protein L0L92_02470 [Corynebacterium variabile]|nr:hypothetical protein [Corynebacterium variabile]